MKTASRASWSFGVWAAGVVLIGGILTSYHQPFRLPESSALAVVLAQPADVRPAVAPGWQATHLLSGGCGCSRRVMVHLLHRRPLPGVSERVVLLDSEETYLPGTAEVMASLGQAGFSTSHVADRDIPADSGLHGVPLLVVTSPDGKVAYLGGYGNAGDGDEQILRQARVGSAPSPLPVLGCAIGRRARKASDPFRLKY